MQNDINNALYKAGKNWTVCEPNGYYYKCATKVDENGVAMAFHNCPVDGSCPLDGYVSKSIIYIINIIVDLVHHHLGDHQGLSHRQQ